MNLTIDVSAVGNRLDVFVAGQLVNLSRSQVAKLIEAEKVRVNNQPHDSKYRLKIGDKVTFDIPSDEVDAILLPIIFENDEVVVIDKPAGVLTHSKGAFNPEGTVASFIADKLSPGLAKTDRGGIVHRLDRDTSGVIICAKTEAARTLLQKQFAQRKTKKTYIAVVEGTPKDPEAILKWPIGRNPKQPQTFRVDPNGKTAETHYTVLQTNGKYSLLELKPTTGRTHQLRVHLEHMGHPIVGDRLYGTAGDRMYLHATSLELTLPGGERRIFESPLPKEFENLVQS